MNLINININQLNDRIKMNDKKSEASILLGNGHEE